MMQKILYLMCGPSGAGKSYWCKHNVNFNSNIPVYYISRDEIRFSMLEPEDDYFAKENEVFAEFIRQIQEKLDLNENNIIIADATHLNEKSRNKTLDALKFDNTVKICPVSIYPGVRECLDRNEQREGRALVPRSVIQRMCLIYVKPSNEEKYKYFRIIEVKE